MKLTPKKNQRVVPSMASFIGCKLSLYSVGNLTENVWMARPKIYVRIDEEYQFLLFTLKT